MENVKCTLRAKSQIQKFQIPVGWLFGSRLMSYFSSMNKINWGIIGCGDVTEVKSGPAFNKVPDSSLVAVMRRDAAKARDYAQRHAVPKWYSNAQDLINDPGVNAIYIATPPSSHEEYALAAVAAGKPVYVEKPMSVDAGSAWRMHAAASDKGVPLVVAHYRRAQPLFKKLKQLLLDRVIGDTRFVRLELYKPLLTDNELAVPKTAWRVDPGVAGGGLFHDLAPHQLDLMYHFFGPVAKASGIGTNQAGKYGASDIVTGNILFKNNIIFDGLWNFSAGTATEKDQCEIIGTKGSIGFSMFDHMPVVVRLDTNEQSFAFDRLEHVQQPMIEQVVRYFLGKGDNPCGGEEGAEVMQLLDRFTS